MTREEFRNDIQDWEGLINFCVDNGLEDKVSDIVSCEGVENIVINMLDCNGWRSLVDFLSSVNSVNDDYYRIDGYGNLEELSRCDFENYKDGTEEDFDSICGFDDDDDGDDCPLEI